MPAAERTAITDEAVTRTLQILFGEEVRRPEDMPRLNRINRTIKGEPHVEGQKPLEQRIEYRMLTDTPRDADGQLTLEGIMKAFPQTMRGFHGKTRAELAGARFIAVLAYAAGADDTARTAVKSFIINTEYGINAGENECGGRHSVLGNSGRSEIEEVNRWVKGWKRDQTVRQPADSLADRVTRTGAPVTRT